MRRMSWALFAHRGVPVLLGVLFVVLIAAFVDAGNLVRINFDAGYYLPRVKAASQGMVLYRDLPTAYTPLALWMTVPVAWAAGESPAYGWFIGLVYVLHFANALLIFVLARRMSGGALPAAAAAVLFLLSCYVLQGVYWVLEPFTILFSLLAMLACVGAEARHSRLFLAGLATGAAFLTKQYGLAVALPVGAWALASGTGLRGRLSRVGVAALGAAVPVVAVLSLYALAYDFPPKEVFSSWYLAGYARTGLWESLGGLRRFWFLLPCVVLVPLLLLSRRFRGDPRFLILGLGALLFGLPLLIRPYLHYLMLVVPWLVLLGVVIIDGAAGSRLLRALVILLMLAGFGVGVSAARGVYRSIHGSHGGRAGQESEAREVSAYVPSGASAVVFGVDRQFLVYLCDFGPTAPPEFGYVWPSQISPAQRARLIELIDFAVVSDWGYEFAPGLAQQLGSAGLSLVTTTEAGTEVWRRH